jgi:ADP-ribosylglycohydrolase
MTQLRRDQAHLRGCLLGGAVGDALGEPVEFISLAEIRARYGPAGITDPDASREGLVRITDDTQMTLFTADGLLRAMTRMADRGICHVPTGRLARVPGLAADAARHLSSRAVRGL